MCYYVNAKDFPGLTHVINFDLPGSANVYLHRAGRVGRTGSRYGKVALDGHSLAVSLSLSLLYHLPLLPAAILLSTNSTNHANTIDVWS
jgi:superfamily II DNA/RNA helicase